MDRVGNYSNPSLKKSCRETPKPGFAILSTKRDDEYVQCIILKSVSETDFYDFLENDVVEEAVADIIRDKNYDAIVELLYSPNYLISLNAYVALVYLDSKGMVQLSPPIQSKSEEIVNNTNSILVVCGKDCVSSQPSYKSLNIHKENIIKKYETSLTKTTSNK